MGACRPEGGEDDCCVVRLLSVMVVLSASAQASPSGAPHPETLARTCAHPL